MNKEIKSIDIYPENYEFESNYIPLISFKTQQQKETIEKYIITKVDIFLQQIIKASIDVKSSQLAYPNTITEKDFNLKKISYFYEKIFFDLEKRNIDNKLHLSPKCRVSASQFELTSIK